MAEAERPSRGWFQIRRAARPRFSAYLSIYNDWDLLAPSLQHLAAHVDELVVVDGAYAWMVPYLTRLGIDPERSDERVYEALAASGVPFRVLTGLWDNEIQKRRAGYEACANRYVLRVDSDELLHFDAAALGAFLASGDAVGEMENPTYVAPGYVLADAGQTDLPRTGFLFDRSRISADLHLNYIWLVLTKDELPGAGQKPFSPHRRALAFSAHLTGWRTPETAEQRSAFYVLNRLRQTGSSWFEDLRGKPLEDFELLFSRASAPAFRNMLRHARFSLGTFSLSPQQRLARTPLSPQQERAFAPLYERFLASLAADNLASTKARQSFGWGGDVVLDLSTEAAYAAIVREGAIAIEFSHPPTGFEAWAHRLTASAPHQTETMLDARLEGLKANITAPQRARSDDLRLVLAMRPRGGVGPLGDYLIV